MSFLVITAFQDTNSTIKSETEEDRIQHKIEELKALCYQETRAHSSLFDPRDIKALECGETGLTLFLESNDWKVEPAMEAVKRHCSWRRENGVLDLKMADIPKEIHQMSLFTPRGFDVNGHPLFYIRLSVAPGPKEFHSTIVKHFLWGCENIRNLVLSNNKKLAIIFDCRNAQVDIGLLKEILDIYTNKYPPAAEYIAFLDMNFGFRCILQVIKYFFPKYLWKKMIFIDQDQLRSMVDESNLPTYLGGSLEALSKEELSQCPSLEDFAAQNGINEKIVNKMKSHVNKIID